MSTKYEPFFRSTEERSRHKTGFVGVGSGQRDPYVPPGLAQQGLHAVTSKLHAHPPKDVWAKSKPDLVYPPKKHKRLHRHSQVYQRVQHVRGKKAIEVLWTEFLLLGPSAGRDIIRYGRQHVPLRRHRSPVSYAAN